MSRQAVPPPLVRFPAQDEIISRADPNSPKPILQKAMRVTKQSFDRGLTETRESAVHVAKHTLTSHSQPHDTLPVSDQGRDRSSLEQTVRAGFCNAVGGKQGQTRTRADPEVSVAVRRQGCDCVRRKAFRHSKR